jgi:hypothetical protein
MPAGNARGDLVLSRPSCGGIVAQQPGGEPLCESTASNVGKPQQMLLALSGLLLALSPLPPDAMMEERDGRKSSASLHSFSSS